LSLDRSPLDGAPITGDQALETLRTILADVIGEEYLAEIYIDRETSFYGDLEIESIEFVALGEQLQQQYGDRVDFPAWIATMEVEEIIAITVGQLVDHIVASLA
jgi:acyl carrier protein